MLQSTSQNADTTPAKLGVSPVSSDLLRWCVEQPERHAKWLNTLSLLEHIGCRKIVKSMDSERADCELLRHVAEEARHALFFKELAERVHAASARDYSDETLLCGDAAHAYIQGLDQDVTQYLESRGLRSAQSLNYLFMTRLIEERAVLLYEAYEAVLRAEDFAFSLRGLLNEEARHLDDMRSSLDALGIAWSEHHAALLALESLRFRDFTDALERIRERGLS